MKDFREKWAKVAGIFTFVKGGDNALR